MDIFGFESRAAKIANGARIQSRDWGEQIPSDLDDVKPYPKFTSVPLGPVEEPIYDWSPGTYSYPTGEPIDATVSADAVAAYIPGIIISFVEAGPAPSPSGFGTTTAVYEVDVYKAGLAGEPERVQVTQLQIANWEEIPVGTWVMVGYSKWSVDEESFEEYTMQVPIWL
jgi:hypothetical protein